MIRILALIGASGSGKTSVAKELEKTYPDMFHRVVPTTTRPMREGEENGVDYHFIDESNLVYSHMACVSEFRGWLYGVDRMQFVEDKINVGAFDPTQVEQLLEWDDAAVQVFFLVADTETRVARMASRELDPNLNEISRRLRADEEDFRHLPFPYVCVWNAEDTSLGEVITAILGWVISQ